jgi:hypothetical protein
MALPIGKYTRNIKKYVTMHDLLKKKLVAKINGN